jgi:crossover junction endodeoxyribonuclease RusA
MRLSLPYPPSTNHYWRHDRGVTHVSREGRRFRDLVGLHVYAADSQKTLTGRLIVRVQACAPDRRRRDLDNVLKALLDALEKSGLYENDSQIDRLIVERAAVDPPQGHMLVDVIEVQDWKRDRRLKAYRSAMNELFETSNDEEILPQRAPRAPRKTKKLKSVMETNHKFGISCLD